MTTNPDIKRVAKLAFPSYKGRKFRVQSFRPGMNVNSYWDGGSRDYFALVSLETGQVFTSPATHPCFDRAPSGDRLGLVIISKLPENTVLVERSIFCGKECGLTVHVPAENMKPAIEDHGCDDYADFCAL